MEFGYSKVLNALARLHQVADDKMSALKARLRHFQTKGFPPGINTGKGKAAAYRPEHIVLLGVALELVELGNSPDRAIKLIVENLEDLARGILRHTNDGEVIYFAPDANGLGDLRHPGEAKNANVMSCSSTLELQRFLAIFDGQPELGLRMSLFSLSGLIRQLSAKMCDSQSEVSDSFIAHIAEWAAEVAAQGVLGQAAARFALEGNNGSDPQA